MNKKLINFIEVIIIVCLFSLTIFMSVKASTLYSNKQTTGYAMGTTGYGSHTFTRGDVATHPLGYCSDPAGSWQRGTIINMTSGISIPGFSGFNPNYDIFLDILQMGYW